MNIYSINTVIHSLANNRLFPAICYYKQHCLYTFLYMPLALGQQFLQNVFISTEYLVLIVYMFHLYNTKMFSKLFLSIIHSHQTYLISITSYLWQHLVVRSFSSFTNLERKKTYISIFSRFAFPPILIRFNILPFMCSPLHSHNFYLQATFSWDIWSFS